MTRYILLRDQNRTLRSGAFFGGPSISGGLEGFGARDMPPAPVVSSETMNAAELREASRDPDILSVARAMPTTLIAPTATAEARQSSGITWGVTATGAADSPVDGAGVTVAVLDTGIDRDHPAFAGVRLTEKDFSGDGNGDVQGHGTHCAGTVFGRDVNGLRIGVAPGVTEAFIGKVLGDTGGGGSEMLFSGIEWASSNDCQVISMSLGFDFPGMVDQMVKQGFPAKLAASAALEGYRMNIRMFDRLMGVVNARAAFNGGSVVVAASGNESERGTHPNFEVGTSVPAAAEGIVSVGAVGEGPSGLTVADFSNTGPMLTGPGVDVISAKTGGGLVSFNGTSMATPHVAGLAALWWQRMGQMGIPVTANGVVARLNAGAVTDVFAPGVDMLDRGVGLAKAPAPVGMS